MDDEEWHETSGEWVSDPNDPAESATPVTVGEPSIHSWSYASRLSPEQSELASTLRPTASGRVASQAQRNARATGNWQRRSAAFDDIGLPLDIDVRADGSEDVLARSESTSSASSNAASAEAREKPAPAVPSSTGKSHKELAIELDEGWRSLQAVMRAELLACGWMDRACEQHDRESELQQRQQLACEGWRYHVCAVGPGLPRMTETCKADTLRAPAGAESADAADVKARATPENPAIRVCSLRRVTYFSQTCRQSLYQPIWECSCGQRFSASPIQARCWPSRHHDGQTWVDIGLLKDYAELGCVGGTASTREWFTALHCDLHAGVLQDQQHHIPVRSFFSS
jgi:hypothetical protein